MSLSLPLPPSLCVCARARACVCVRVCLSAARALQIFDDTTTRSILQGKLAGRFEPCAAKLNTWRPQPPAALGAAVEQVVRSQSLALSLSVSLSLSHTHTHTHTHTRARACAGGGGSISGPSEAEWYAAAVARWGGHSELRRGDAADQPAASCALIETLVRVLHAHTERGRHAQTHTDTHGHTQAHAERDSMCIVAFRARALIHAAFLPEHTVHVICSSAI